MKTDKATPRPWEIRYGSGIDYAIISPNHGMVVESVLAITDMETMNENEAEQQANAELIIRAVNAHEKLVEALDAILIVTAVGPNCIQKIEDVRQIAIEALKLAKP